MGKLIPLDPSRVSTRIVETAAKTVRSGGIFIYPTDTIYGIGCDASNSEAVKRIFELKRRPQNKPALVLAYNRSMIWDLVSDIPPSAERLMDQFWPGPLTILLRARRNIHPFLRSREWTIGVRIPDNRFCLKLLARCRVPIVSTSANLSGALPDRSVLMSHFLDQVDLFIDAGELPPSLPSTVIDVTGKTPRIVREGAIAETAIFKVLA